MRTYNYVPNPGGEGATASLEAQSGATVAIVTTAGVGWPARGTKSYSVTATGTAVASGRLRLVDRPSAVAAKRWHARAALRAAAGNTGTRRYRLSLVAYTAAPGSTEGTATIVASTDVDLAPSAIADVSVQGVLPSGTLSAGFYAQRVSGVLNAATGDVFHLDDLMLAQADAATSPIYGDGDNAAWIWTGTAHASTSYTADALPVLTKHEPGAGEDFAPWVEVLVSELWPKATRATVERTSEGRAREVRGGVDLPVAGGISVPDFEPGFAVPSSYRVKMSDANGQVLGYSESREVTVASTVAWLQQPLDPASAVRVKIGIRTADTIGRPFAGGLVGAPDSSTPRWIGGARQSITGMALSVQVRSRAAADRIQEMLGGYDEQLLTPVLLLRTLPPLRLPRVFFVDCSDLTERSTAPHLAEGAIFFEGRVTEARPPFPGLVKPLLTYDDLDAFYGIYSAQDARYGSYLEKDRDYSLAGYSR